MQNKYYKKTTWKNVAIDSHRKKLLKSIGINKNIDRKWIVHHLDGNKRNNDINNLALMTITAHNKIHSHIPWNKGLKAENNKKLAKAIKKTQIKRKKYYLKQWKKWYKLRKSGKTYIEISKIIGRCRETISQGVKKYEKEIRKGADL